MLTVPEGRGELRFTRDDVLELEHPAWNEDARYSFDGVVFWMVDEGQCVVDAAETPPGGWWHRPACSCPACRGGGARPAGGADAVADRRRRSSLP